MEQPDDLTPLDKKWGRILRRFPPTDCLPAPQLIELAEKGKRCRNYRERIAHVCACDKCRDFYLEFREDFDRHKARLGTPWWQRPPVLVGGLAGAVALALLFVGARTFLRIQDTDHLAQNTSRPPVRQANPDHRELQPTIVPPKESVQIAGLPAGLEYKAGQMLANGMPVPAFGQEAVQRLAKVALGTQAGGTAESPVHGGIDLLTPRPGNRGLYDTRPSFRLKLNGPLTRYNVQLIADMDETTLLYDLKSDQIKGEVLIVPRYALQRGHLYRLEVSHRLDPNAPPETTGGKAAVYTFKVLSTFEAGQYEWTQHQGKEQPAVCVAVFWALDMYQDALDTLASIHRSKDETLARWAAKIKEKREERLRDVQR